MMGLLFTYGLTFGGALASLYKPWYGFLAYIIFAILRPPFLWPWSVGTGNYSRIIAAALIVGWAIHGFGNWNFGKAWPIVYCLIAYWFATLLSTSAAEVSEIAWPEFEIQTKILLPVLVGITLCDSIERLKTLAWVIAISLGFIAYEANLDHFRGGFLFRLYGMAGVDNNSISIALVAGAGLAFFLGISEQVAWKRWGAFALAGLMAHCPMFGMSRGGMLGLLVTGIVAAIIMPKRPKDYAFLVLAATVAMTLAGESARARFLTAFADEEERDESAQHRLDLWAACVDMAKERPITGVGPNHFPMMAARRGLGGYAAHSRWFSTLAELGLPGIISLLGFFLGSAYAGWQLMRTPNPVHPWIPHLGRMVVASLTGFMVSTSFVTVNSLEPPYFVAILAICGLVLQGSYEAETATEEYGEAEEEEEFDDELYTEVA